ncbi:MAG: EpsG family protein [Campylobacteraceae bacterium]|nr:EpsG family protein [Campylobacteraceae bacterium]
MTTQYTIVIFYIFFISAYVVSIHCKAIRGCLYKITLLIMFLLLSFQDGYGTDYNMYKIIFLKNAETDTFPDYKGFTMYYIIKAINLFTNNPIIFFSIWSALQILFLNFMLNVLYKFYNFKDKLQILMYILISLSFFTMMFNTLRSIFITMLVPVIFIMFYERKKIKSLFLTIIGFMFHPTIITILPFIMVFNFFKKHYKATFILSLFIAVFVINRANLVPSLAEFIYNNTSGDNVYRNYLVSYHMKPYAKAMFGELGIWFVLIMNLLSLVFYAKVKDSKTIFLYNLGYFAGLLRIFSYGIPIFGRVYMLFNIFEFFIAYFLFNNLKYGKTLYLGYWVLLAYLITAVKYIFSMG